MRLSDTAYGSVANAIAFATEPYKPQLEKIKTFDWTGGLLGVVGFGALSTMLEQSDRYDWFDSQTICVLALVSAVAVPSLTVNKMVAKEPLLGLYLMKRCNFAYGIITLFAFLLLTEAASTVPVTFLTQVAGFLPQQAYMLTAPVAAAQLVLLPAVAILLNVAWVDARVVSFIDLACIVTACLGNSTLISSDDVATFLLWQGLQAVGQPMVVVPLLMMSTNTITSPADGPRRPPWST